MMPSRDVPRQEWPEFLESFSRQHRAWLALVEQPGDVPRAETYESARPLAAVTPERRGSRVAAIEISFAADSGTPTVRVENPTTVRLHQTREGADRTLEIIDEDGQCTRLGFRVTAPPDMLDGLAPTEA